MSDVAATLDGLIAAAREAGMALAAFRRRVRRRKGSAQAVLGELGAAFAASPNSVPALRRERRKCFG